MKYKVGDKVRIKSNLKECNGNHYIVNYDMLQFSGRLCTISEVYDDCYFLLEDEHDWYWTDEMIEGVPEYKPGDKVRIRKDLITRGQYGTECFTPNLEPYKGTICTIDHKTTRRNGTECYRIKEDGGKWGWTPEMFECKIDPMEQIAKYGCVPHYVYEDDEDDDTTLWDEWKKSRRSYVWTTKDGESMLLSGMKTGHIQNALALLKRTNTPREIKDGVCHSSWIEAFEKELQYREIKDVLNAQYGEHARAIVHEWLNKPQKENKENKEDIEMSNTQLIENKLEKELRALKKARNEEIKNKFYETTVGKAAKAFNEALERDGNENQKEYFMIDIDDLMERGEENFGEEINAEYDAKSLETKEYYAEAKSLFENADTYEQKVAILKEYGILKGPKAKAKVEVK